MQDFRVKSGLRVSGNVYGVDYLTANNINVTYNGIFGNLTVNGSIVGNVTGTVSSLSNQTTSNLAEGTNQYFTNARAYANLTAASINALADVDTVTNPPGSGYGLVWNGTAWVPSVITASTSQSANVANTAIFAANSNIANIITDLVSDTGRYKPNIVYNPSAQYRLIQLQGNRPISNLDIVVYWKDRTGSLNDFKLSSGSSATIKILFTKKTLGN